MEQHDWIGLTKQEQLIRHFRMLIVDGLYKSGQSFPPEVQLARELGVNRGTVGKALNALVGEGLLVRRQGSGTFVAPHAGVPEERGAVDDLSAGALTRKGRGPAAEGEMSEGLQGGAAESVAAGADQGLERVWSPRNILILASLKTDDPNTLVNPSGAIITGVEAENDGAAHGCRIGLLNFCPEVRLTEQIVLEVRRRNPDGVIHLAFGGLEDVRREVELLKDSGLPFVAVFPPGISEEVDSVSAAQEDYGYLAASHLLLLGHRKLLYIIPELEEIWLDRRVQGFRRALKEAGVPFSPSMLFRHGTLLGCLPHEGSREGAEAAELLLRSGLDATGILTVNDAYAAGLLRTFRAAGIAVPEQVSVVGTDDHFQFRDSNLTTVRQPFQRIGATALALLLRRLTGKGREYEHHLLRPQLVERETSSPCQISQ